MKKNKLLSKALLNFEEKFGAKPLLSFAPGRINIIGEHTDYNNGFVLPAAINQGVVSAGQFSSKKKCQLYSLDFNETFDFAINEIGYVRGGNWRNYVLGVISEILKIRDIKQNFDLLFTSNLPIGAGLSSSAALENSIVLLLNELFDLKLSLLEMVHISQQAENKFVKVKCGIMDQYVSFFGKRNHAILLDCKDLTTSFIKINLEEYQFILVNTNVHHNLEDGNYNQRRIVCMRTASLLKAKTLREISENKLNRYKNMILPEDYEKALYVIQENQRVIAAVNAIERGNIEKLGMLLFDSHNGLQHLYKTSCKELDFIVNICKELNCVKGARMMGGGFGGCVLALVKQENIKVFKEIIRNKYVEMFSISPSFYKVKIADGAHMI